jgi:DNA phosphorothioation-associated putative methyltransferase
MSEAALALSWEHLSQVYDAAVKALNGGKRVVDNSYLHVSLIASQDDAVQRAVEMARGFVGLEAAAFNVVRFARSKREIALLDYEDFFEAPFPALRASWLIDVDNARQAATRFGAQENPPILHRKELLLPEDAPQRAAYEDLTRALEDYGAFDKPAHLIGRRQTWASVLSDLGLKIVDGEVRTSQAEAALNIVRHRTAIARSRLSSPMQALARWGFFENASVFDYGCGRGDDIRALLQAGIDARGWDPYFASNEARVAADVVNLGFVLNVIEDQAERREALEQAFGLTRRVLAVAVMLQGRGTGERARDGVVTTRGTFQKYYAQSEIAEYIRRVIKRDPIAVGPGLFFVFRSDDDEQSFLAKRQRSAVLNRDLLDSMFPARAPRGSKTSRVRQPKPSVYETHRDLLDAFWEACLSLGRIPEPDEFDLASIQAEVGSVRRAVLVLPFPDKDEQLKLAAKRRTDDLLVYLGLNLFERRRSFSSQPISIQRDVKAFFGSNARALEEARQTLFATGSREKLAATIEEAARAGLGVRAPDGDFTLFRGSLDRQPPLIRLIVGCAERLEPIPETTELIKVHAEAGQVSFIEFDDFAGKPLPVLTHRVKVDLRHQRVRDEDFADRTDRRVLFGKSRFLPPDFRRYDTQVRFDNRLAVAGIYTTSGLGVNESVLQKRLSTAGLRLIGFRILNTSSD